MNPAEQIRQAFLSIETVLKHGGMNCENIVEMTTYLDSLQNRQLLRYVLLPTSLVNDGNILKNGSCAMIRKCSGSRKLFYRIVCKLTS